MMNKDLETLILEFLHNPEHPTKDKHQVLSDYLEIKNLLFKGGDLNGR